MSLDVAALEALVAAGATPEMLLAVIRVNEQKNVEKRQRNAERMRGVRARSRTTMHNDAQQRTIEHNGALSGAEPLSIVAEIPASTMSGVTEKACASTFAHAETEPALSMLPTFETKNPKKEEKKERAKRNRGEILPIDWRPKPEHFTEAIELRFSNQNVLDQAEDMRLWARSNEHREVARKSNWDSTFTGWMRRNAKGNGHGQHRHDSKSSDRQSGGRGHSAFAAQFARSAAAGRERGG